MLIMNKLVLILGFLVFPFFGFSQNTKSNSIDLNPISENYYSVKISRGSIKQSGYFIIEDDKPVMNGKWIMRINGKKTLIGMYDGGVLNSLTVFENGQKIKYDKHQLEVGKLKSRINRLENLLAVE